MEPETALSTLAQLSHDLADAVERAGASVVTVNARRRLPASGIIWSETGQIVTANHVVERDDEITIVLPDGQEVPATLVGRDQGTDLALLQASATGLAAAPRATDAARVGHLVLAIGRPGPGGPMASFGSISLVGGSWRRPRGGRAEGFIRADVAMLPGFSGGPLVDARGAVLGLNSSTLGRGTGLTVPASVIDATLAALGTDGRIKRGYLGVAAHNVALGASLQSSLGLSQSSGLLVVAVEPDSPAERDGLLLGDIIIALNGDAVTDVDALQDRLGGEWVGQALPMRVIRGGASHDATVTIGEREQ